MVNRPVQYYGPSGSFKVGELPEGCKKCIQGAKLVVFATGACNVGCYYCTIPHDERKSDNIAINEIKLSNSDDVISTMVNESELCIAKGAGITGGDPLLKPERTLHYIRNLKSEFGADYHIHLYTSGQYLDFSLLEDLVDAGLDEIRFHPKNITDQSIWELASNAKKTFPQLVVGFEVPVLPTHKTELISLITYANWNKIDFVNLNEFEFTESNYSHLDKRGFVSVLHNAAVKGSSATALQVIQEVKDDTSIPIHFCSSASKDAIQLVQRYKRRASKVRRPFESISDEGELEYGRLVVFSDSDLSKLKTLLINMYEVPESLIDVKDDSIETSWLIVSELIDDLREQLPDLQAEIICRYPVQDGPITYVNPL